MFGEVVNCEMQLNRLGMIVSQAWEWLACQYLYVDVEPYVIMPNHFHAIIQIREIGDFCSGGLRPAAIKNNKTKPLGQLIGAFKTRSSKYINIERGTQGSPTWQRNYYEHIIRNSAELEKIGKYILSNPVRWSDDPENQP
jgi:putative transposase